MHKLARKKVNERIHVKFYLVFDSAEHHHGLVFTWQKANTGNRRKIK